MNWEELKSDLLKKIDECIDEKKLNDLKVEIMGKKGIIAGYMNQMKDLSIEEKKEFGKEINEIKKSVEEYLGNALTNLKSKAMAAAMAKDKIDVTLNGYDLTNGNLHPLEKVQRELEDIFVSMGYSIVTGPEVEHNLYNFERANTPEGHPARAMQDTFYIDADRLLRTQTTAIQTRCLEMYHDKLPIKVVCPGRVFRRDDDDATHSHQFTQMEGLVVGENITLADLKGTLELMCRTLFGQSREIRLRPSYFPFTEPSVEADVSCHVCGGKGCNVCKGTGWIEILGAGMVHPNVLEMAGIDSKKYTGFAFGVGVERVAMLKYGTSDIRDLYTNDVRFLKEFNKVD